jgi:integrase/recombinase XerD
LFTPFLPRQFSSLAIVAHTGAGRAEMQSLFDGYGKRKYVVAAERRRFVTAALEEGGAIASFCATLALTGARISEVLALTAGRIDADEGAIVFETLKRRRKGVFRAVPVPRELLHFLETTHRLSMCVNTQRQIERLWPWCRTTAWCNVRRVMQQAEIDAALSTPRALRHGFAVEATQNGISLNMVQRWLGHARIETTAIYASALGKEERALARRTWRGLETALRHVPKG